MKLINTLFSNENSKLETRFGKVLVVNMAKRAGVEKGGDGL